MRGVVFLQAGDAAGGVPQQVVLASLPPNAPPFADRLQRGLHHIGLEVPPGSLPHEKARLEALGVSVRTGEHPFLPVEAIYIDDPDGNEVELVAARA
jgi:catechol-2,3-dioxygenase